MLSSSNFSCCCLCMIIRCSCNALLGIKPALIFLSPSFLACHLLNSLIQRHLFQCTCSMGHENLILFLPMCVILTYNMKNVSFIKIKTCLCTWRFWIFRCFIREMCAYSYLYFKCTFNNIMNIVQKYVSNNGAVKVCVTLLSLKTPFLSAGTILKVIVPSEFC
jgi:hypothetical protein